MTPNQASRRLVARQNFRGTSSPCPAKGARARRRNDPAGLRAGWTVVQVRAWLFLFLNK